MLRNIITMALTRGYIFYICVQCVQLYKYIRKYKGLDLYTWLYTGCTHFTAGPRCVQGTLS
jgi:hypothetical protein